MIEYIISVDGGGTKTKTIGYDKNGCEIDYIITGPGSAAVVSEDDVWHNVHSGLNDLYKKIDQNKYQLKYIQVGLSAYSILENIEENINKIRNEYKVEVSVDSDTVVACHSILKDNYENGVVALAGTGVAVFGIKKAESCLIGGWGHIIRELGSAYAAVHHFALNIIDTAENGHHLSTFQEDFIKYLKQKNINDLKFLFYFHSKTEIASLVTFIKKYAKEGNFEAKAILYQEGVYLAEQALKAINKLSLKDNYVIGLRGGFVQKDSNDVVEGFIQTLREKEINVTIISDNDDPAIGGYFIAKKRNLI